MLGHACHSTRTSVLQEPVHCLPTTDSLLNGSSHAFAATQKPVAQNADYLSKFLDVQCYPINLLAFLKQYVPRF